MLSIGSNFEQVKPVPNIYDFYDDRWADGLKKEPKKQYVDIDFDSMPLLDFEKKHGIAGEYSSLVSVFALYCRITYLSGPWFAGGLYRRAIQHESFADYNADIDIFFTDKEQSDNFQDLLKTEEISTYTELTNVKFLVGSPYSKTYTADVMGKNMKIQCIDYKFFPTPQNLLKQFDLFSCMFATDGANMTFEKHLAVKAATEKVLKYNWSYLDRKSPTMMFAKRFKKFMTEGYDTSSNNEYKRIIRFIQEMDKVSSSAYMRQEYGNMSTDYSTNKRLDDKAWESWH